MQKVLICVLILLGAYCLCRALQLHERSDWVPLRVEHGIASWYGPSFYGRRTADGTVLERHSRWVAHKTLRFGTRVRVTDLETGRSVVAEVKDRGPYVRGRIVDLTEALALELGIHERGIVHVRMDVL